MKLTQNPFSVYDFLGYLVPGVLQVLLVLLVQDPASLISDPIGHLSLAFPTVAVEVYLPGLVIAYMLGHLLSYISSMTIEKYSVWTIGYPSVYLFQPQRSALFRAPTELSGWSRVANTIVRWLVLVVLLPVVLLDAVLGRAMGFRGTMQKPLDDHLAAHIRRSVERLVHRDHLEDGEDHFRILYHHSLEHCPAHNYKFSNYVALYGFTRTMTLVLTITAWVALVAALRNGAGTWPSVLLVAAVSLVAYVSYADFNKFYRKFSLEVLMAIGATGIADDRRGTPE